MAIKRGKKYQARWTDASGKKRGKTFSTQRLALSYERKQKTEVEEQRAGRAFGLEPGKRWEDGKKAYYERAPEKTRKDARGRSVFSRYLDTIFNGLLLTEIRAEHIAALERAIAHLSPKTQRNILGLLGAVLNEAKRRHWVALTPLIRKPKVVRDPTEIRFLVDLDAVYRLLAAARAINELLYLAVALAAFTGMRKGELAGLRWCDISLDEARITIRRSYDAVPKSGKGRVVPLFNQLRPILVEFKLKASSDLVLPTTRGTMRDPNSRLFKDTFAKALRGAGFPDRCRQGQPAPHIRFHDLRHTFASLFLAWRGDIFKLQRFLGHASVNTTNVYAHLVPAAFDEELSRFGAPPNAAQVISLADRRSS